MKIVIPSKGRAELLPQRTLKLIPDALVCVGDDEVKAYAKVTQNLLVHPAHVVGVGPIKQWILDHVDDPSVFIIDDDFKAVYDQTGFHKRLVEPATVPAIIERVALMAQEAGCRIYGFQQNSRPISYAGFKPFTLNTWVSAALGVIGRELRFDTRLMLRCDIDLCLESLRHDRFVWVENRYYLAHDTFCGTGGNARQRSAERHEQEIRYLKRKWGPYLNVANVKRTTRLSVTVPR